MLFVNFSSSLLKERKFEMSKWSDEKSFTMALKIENILNLIANWWTRFNDGFSLSRAISTSCVCGSYAGKIYPHFKKCFKVEMWGRQILNYTFRVQNFPSPSDVIMTSGVNHLLGRKICTFNFLDKQRWYSRWFEGCRLKWVLCIFCEFKDLGRKWSKFNFVG